jgi:Rrf2 family protein
MASNDEVVSAVELADILKIPHPFLRSILRTLKEHGIIASRRGQNGGFHLEKDPEKITLLDLVTIFQGPFHLTECASGDVCPRSSACPLKPELSFVEKEIILKFQRITVNGIAKNSIKLQGKKESVC